MTKPLRTEVFVCARDWQEATVIAEALATGKIQTAARHTSRDEAQAWCDRLNSGPVSGRKDAVYHVRATKHFGPDSVIYSFANIGA